MKYLAFIAVLLIAGCTAEPTDTDANPRPLQLLFLGHASQHHNSYEFAPILMRKWTKEGIHITYSENINDLNKENLRPYDGLILYANHDSISVDQENALLEFVRNGKGFIPIHCASYCFRNSDSFVKMVGGQFKSHDTATFTADIVDPTHPVMDGIQPFSTWDETYVHDKLSEDRLVLMERVEGDRREPWTWVRKEGDGRVFYTAYGHDKRTWNNPGFQNLIKNGVLWAVGNKAYTLWEQFHADIPDLIYKDSGQIPNYEERDPPPRFQEPLTPEESKKLIQVPAGFKLQLFASEPDIVNPLSMAWDERGRLWVIETIDYPNTVRNVEGTGDDQIKICEDTDGDGKADKFTVFAKNLNIPTSMVFVNGGVLVSQAPEFIFLKDTDGDDVADVKKVVMNGWGTYDTHAGPSNLQYGLDNHIWGVVGYSGFKGNIDNENLEFRQGIYRFDRNYGSFEKLGNTSNNTWGLGFTETNQVFASTANNTHSVFMGIPNQYYRGIKGLENRGSIKIDGHYPMHPVTEKVRQVDVFGGFTAASGHYFYTARNYPEKYWNNHAMVAEPTGHLVHWAHIVPDGAGFTEEDGGNLIAGADEWFAPVAAKVGPDGHVWVADWYNFIVQHNPTPSPERGGYQAENGPGNAYINPLRDKDHGRIWRIIPQKSSTEPTMYLDRHNPDQLVKELTNSNQFWRLTAQRLLVERGETDVVDELIKLLSNRHTDEIGNSPGVLHALWTLDGLDQVDGQNKVIEHVSNLLEHPAPSVQKGAIQILSKTPQGQELLKKTKIWKSDHPEVQLAALLAISTWEPDEQIGKELYNVSQDKSITDDDWLSQALYIAAANHLSGFLNAYTTNQGEYFPVESDNKSSLTWTQRFLNHYWDDSAVNTINPSSFLTEKVQEIQIGVVKNEMKYDRSEFVVEAGEPVQITFVNDDFMQHNLIISIPGSLQKVGKAADKLAMEPDGAEKQYVPEIPEVLHHTGLVDPNETVTLRFVAPDKPGEYPFVCTFPGHWRLMNGLMKVMEK